MEPQSIGDGVLGPLHERAYAIKAPRPRAPARAQVWASSWIDEKSLEVEEISPSKPQLLRWRQIDNAVSTTSVVRPLRCPEGDLLIVAEHQGRKASLPEGG